LRKGCSQFFTGLRSLLVSLKGFQEFQNGSIKGAGLLNEELVATPFDDLQLGPWYPPCQDS